VPNFIKIGQTVADTWRFNGFHIGGRPPSWILKFQIFYRSARLRDRFCIIVPSLAKIVQAVEEISRFLWFFKMAAAAILIFEKFEILMVCPL